MANYEPVARCDHANRTDSLCARLKRLSQQIGQAVFKVKKYEHNGSRNSENIMLQIPVPDHGAFIFGVMRREDFWIAVVYKLVFEM